MAGPATRPPGSARLRCPQAAIRDRAAVLPAPLRRLGRTPGDRLSADLVVGGDGRARCAWGAAPPDYLTYHDREWGRPVRDDDGIFERLSLEAFQAGLSWLTILRKRAAFRSAFAGFSIERVARYGENDVRRLVADAAIVRNRAKIEAVVANARVARTVEGGLGRLVWSFAPTRPSPPPQSLTDVAARSPESTAMAHELKGRGFRFIGPTTAYALMQACGLVDDHLADCWARTTSEY